MLFVINNEIVNTEIFQKSSTSDSRNTQQEILMQHSFLLVNILVPSRLNEHNVLSNFFILSSEVLLEQEITQIAFTR